MLELLQDLSRRWQWPAHTLPYTVTADLPFNEAGLLKLNCDKALAQLRWNATLKYEECVELVGDWYHSYYRQNGSNGTPDLQARTLQDIARYEQLAGERGLRWAPARATAPASPLLQAA